jgi:7-cyano-7-deazaguanine reductase
MSKKHPSGKQRADAAGTPYASLTLLHRNPTPYPDSPDKAHLETFPNPCAKRPYWITFDCPEFSSLCPVTNQPDYGHIIIRYIPDRLCIESKSLKLYLFAYRNHNTFHEAAVNRILDDLLQACRPRQASVEGNFNPRGGIGIRVSAIYPDAATP